MNIEQAAYLLGIRIPFTTEQLRSAYRKAAHKTHPDKGGSSKAFVNIQEAYELLQTLGSAQLYTVIGRYVVCRTWRG